MNEAAVDGSGNSQSEELSLEIKNDLSEIDLLLLSGSKLLQYLRESLRSSASTATQSTAVHLSCVPVEECLALAGAWLGRQPKATDHCRDQILRLLELPCHEKTNLLQLEMGISLDELPHAFLEGMGSQSELTGLHSIISATLYACPRELQNDETNCFLRSFKAHVFRANNGIQENVFKGKKCI
ncbi:protein FAM220A [Dasypus novemcinctus]|uniref:protein FAM220A n=1 Tax=Dasypus novemcinctus TaxID=9361 RepID=UPI0039C9AE1C